MYATRWRVQFPVALVYDKQGNDHNFYMRQGREQWVQFLHVSTRGCCEHMIFWLPKYTHNYLRSFVYLLVQMPNLFKIFNTKRANTIFTRLGRFYTQSDYHPRDERSLYWVPTLVIWQSNWFIFVILIGCSSVLSPWSNHTITISPVILFFTPGYQIWSQRVVHFTAFWLDQDVLTQSKILYHPRRLNLLKQFFLVVGGGGW